MLVGHPFDLVKVRLQTADKGVYTGAIDVVKRTVAREGLARVSRVPITPIDCDAEMPHRVCMLEFQRRSSA